MTGGAVSQLTTAVSPAFAMDDTFVYYAVGLQDAFRIAKAPLAGGAAELVACVPATLPSAPDRFAVDDGNVYFASSSDGRVFAVPK